METTVSSVVRLAMGASAACGIRPRERRTAQPRKPRMNQGTSRPRTLGRAAGWAASRRRADSSDRTSTTGPSISTRTSLTSVPSCTLSAPTGAVAARTCGTA